VDDIPLLASSMINQLRKDKHEMELDVGALDKLKNHRWPGNLRELHNTLERALLRVRGDKLAADDIRLDTGLAEPPSDDLRTLAQVEAEHIRRVFQAEGGHVDRAAVRLGISRSSLYTKLKALGLLNAR
jgi:DNA-binding NtrC family response regulator